MICFACNKNTVKYEKDKNWFRCSACNFHITKKELELINIYNDKDMKRIIEIRIKIFKKGETNG